MLCSLISKLPAIGYRLMTLLISLSFAINGYVGPSSEQPIEPVDRESVKLTFAAWADPQVSNYIVKRTPYFVAACEDISNNVTSPVDALLIAGDIAENGLDSEYKYISEKLSTAKVSNYLIAIGNHDIRLKNYKKAVTKFTDFSNSLNENVGSDLKVDSLHYSYEVNGYRFIILGTDRTEFEESYLSEAQLDWLDGELANATADGKPTFVMCHQTFKNTHGLPGTWNSPIDSAGSIGKQSEVLYNIMNKYENVFMITGHLHTGIGQYTYEKLGNINSVNLPSLTISNKDGDLNDNGIGFMVEVYENKVLFRARTFAKGIYEPDYDIEIPLV